MLSTTMEGKISFAAVMYDSRVRVKEGFVTSLSCHMPEPKHVYSTYDRVPIAVKTTHDRIEVNLSLLVGDDGMVVEKYDPFAPIPIGSKTVDECTNDELLFAIQYRLGLLHGELFKHA